MDIPDSKVHGAYMGPTWGRQDPGGPHVGPMILAIWDMMQDVAISESLHDVIPNSIQDLEKISQSS